MKVRAVPQGVAVRASRSMRPRISMPVESWALPRWIGVARVAAVAVPEY